MPEANHSPEFIPRLLAGAATTVAGCRYCWLLTPTATADDLARPMGVIARNLDAESWTLSFVTDGRSRKAQRIRQSPDISLIFHREAEDAYARLIGTAVLVEKPDVVGRRWKSAYDPYFPTEEDRRNASFVDVRIERMNLWIRGVTPEPFGLQTTTLARDEQGGWRIV